MKNEPFTTDQIREISKRCKVSETHVLRVLGEAREIVRRSQGLDIQVGEDAFAGLELRGA